MSEWKRMDELLTALPPEYKNVDENAFRNFLSWDSDSRNLQSMIIVPFSNSAKSSSPYNDENIPPKSIETPLEQLSSHLRNVKMSLITNPTTKTPSYSFVNQEFGSYLNLLSEQYQKGNRTGFRTIDGKPYIRLSEVIAKLNGLYEDSISGKEGVSHTLKFLGIPEYLYKTPESLRILRDRNYGALTDINAEEYVKAINMKKEGDNRNSLFKELLLKDSVSVLGKLPEDKPEFVPYPTKDKEYDFIHQIEPRTSTKYSQIINAFIKEPPKKISSKSSMGDFYKIEMLSSGEEGIRKFLEERKQLDQGFVNDYDSKIRGNDILISFEGLKDRLSFYRKNSVTRTIEQNIYVRFSG
jgi:hypothetical protein